MKTGKMGERESDFPGPSGVERSVEVPLKSPG
jgi:hypothetical protein